MRGERAWLSEDAGRRPRLLRERARVLGEVRAFFDARGFLEVETPALVPSPGMDLHLDAYEVPGAGYLSTSPELQMKRLLVGGLDRIYQLCRCFRRGEQGQHHQREFTMLEWYRADAGSEDVMRDTEELVAAVVTAVRGEPALELTSPAGSPTARSGEGILQAAGVHGGKRRIDVRSPWPRLTVDEAFRAHAGVSLHDVLPDEERFFHVLVDRIEPALAEGGPVFLTRWPASMASLARLCDDDPTVADRFEAYVAGVELCNGFGELTDPAEQRARLLHQQAERRRLGKRAHPLDERFLAALAAGLPPCAGVALGVDRLVMLAVGAAALAEVIAFPIDRA